MNEALSIIRSLQNRIYEIRGQRVMLDFDLAALYEVETRVFNQAIKRNIKRFPEDFMFQLTKEEFENMRLRFVAAYSQNIDNQENLMSQIVISSWGGTRKLPYAFTEQGVAMLSGVINSDKAINMNISIMRAFVEIRKIVLQQSDVKEQLKQIKERLGEHDVQLSQIYDAIENILDEKAVQRKWEERARIGFRKNAE